ncbi:DUF5683 domain-containing protein [Niabella digestorum]|uniref:DUF5683 domain-containing protein n=1 Tax=Niabella digestorum TaxID=3117701 RepID=A0ABU7RE21_9BACT
MQLFRRFFLFVLLLGSCCVSNAQTDTTAVENPKDSITISEESNLANIVADSLKPKGPKMKRPRDAALRSAILPGWGQVYNKKIWKVPIVYGALGGTGGYFLYNRKWYREYRDAVRIITELTSPNGSKDSTAYLSMNENIRKWYERNQAGGLETLRFYRDDTRKKLDYSFLYFLLAWALNVVDATVDAHLQQFDISPDITFRVQPGYSEMARTSGISLVLHFK